MKSFWIQPDGTTEIKETVGEPNFKEVQRFCGGFVELVNVLFHGKQCHMAVKDDGALIGLPVNEMATEIYWANSRARGVDPADPVQHAEDVERANQELCKNLGIDRETLQVIDINPNPGAPKIYGPVVVLDGRFE